MTVYALHILYLNEICALSIKGMPGLKEIPTKCPFSWEGERGREVKRYLAKLHLNAHVFLISRYCSVLHVEHSRQETIRCFVESHLLIFHLCRYVQGMFQDVPGYNLHEPVTLSDFHCVSVSGRLQSNCRPWDVIYYLKTTYDQQLSDFDLSKVYFSCASSKLCEFI